MPLFLLLALRFLRSSTQEKTISLMLKICFVSIVISTGSLTLIAAIMHGFEKATYKKLQGIHADITIHAHEKGINYKKLSAFLTDTHAATIEASSPTHISQVLLHNKADESSSAELCFLRALDPQEEAKVSALLEILQCQGDTSWNDFTGNTIFIGEPLARRLQLKKGSEAVLHFHQGTRSNKIVLDEKEVKIGGLFKTGILEFDEQMLLAPVSLVDQLYRAKITHVLIKLRDRSFEPQVLASLRKKLSFDVYSWKDLYPSLLSALTLEKWALIFILILVTIISGFTILALLFMYITQKRSDIALLKAMGMSTTDIMLIFHCISFFLTMAATVCGIVLASGITFILNTYPFIKLPDAYYVTHLPAQLSFTIIGGVALLACLMSLIAAFLPSQKVRTMKITDVFKGLAL